MCNIFSGLHIPHETRGADSSSDRSLQDGQLRVLESCLPTGKSRSLPLLELSPYQCRVRYITVKYTLQK
jgi:hypothetical protein